MADIQHLIKQMRDYSTSVQAQQTLIELGAEAVEPLLAQLSSPEQADRALAIDVLEKMIDPRALMPLMELSARDPVPVIRSDAVSAVARYADPRVRDFLLQTAHNPQQDVIIRMTAVFEVGKLAGDEAANALWLELLDDPAPAMVMNAANQLGSSQNAAAYDPLTARLKRLGEADPAIITVLSALGKLGDKRAFEAIAAHLNSKQVHIRAAAVHALTYLGDVRALDALEPLRRDNTISGQEDRGGPTYTLGSEAKRAINTIRKANGMLNDISDERPPKPWWKFW